MPPTVRKRRVAPRLEEVVQRAKQRSVANADVLRPVQPKATKPPAPLTDLARDKQAGRRRYEDGSFEQGRPFPTTQQLYQERPAPPVQERPLALKPPVTTGPTVGPPGVVRARTAGRMGYGDKARGELSRTPINWRPLDSPEGSGVDEPAGTYSDGALNLNSRALPPWGGEETTAHEMSHKRWFEELQAQSPEVAQDFLRDTGALYEENPAVYGAMEDWQGATPYYEQYHDNPNAGRDWAIAPTEIHARVAERVTDPAQLPDWYRKKWYPGVWRDDDRRLNQRPRRQDWEPRNEQPGFNDWRLDLIGDKQNSMRAG